MIAFGWACALQAQTVTTTPGTSDVHLSTGFGNPAQSAVDGREAEQRQADIHTSTPATDYWLTVNMDSGTLPASISVEVNPTSLPVGTYTSAVTITVAGVASRRGGDSERWNVTSPPSTLSREAQQPDLHRAAQSVGRANGDAVHQRLAHLLHATAGAAWLSVSPAVGIVLPGDLVTLTVNVDARIWLRKIAPYTANITVVASGASVTAKSQNILVTVTVKQRHAHYRERLASGASRECREPKPSPFAGRVSIRLRSSTCRGWRRRW